MDYLVDWDGDGKMIWKRWEGEFDGDATERTGPDGDSYILRILTGTKFLQSRAERNDQESLGAPLKLVEVCALSGSRFRL